MSWLSVCSDRCLSSTNYTGYVNLTLTGKACEPWQTNIDYYNDRDFLMDGRSLRAAKNYCRAVKGSQRLQCLIQRLPEDCYVDLCGRQPNKRHQ